MSSRDLGADVTPNWPRVKAVLSHRIWGIARRATSLATALAPGLMARTVGRAAARAPVLSGNHLDPAGEDHSSGWVCGSLLGYEDDAGRRHPLF
jgi:hypothetical protein